MKLCWYIHWFWITTTINTLGCVGNDKLISKLLRATTVMSVESGANINNKTEEISLISASSTISAKHDKEKTVTLPSMTQNENFTLYNTSQSLAFTTEETNNYNENLTVTSERIGIEIPEGTENLTGFGITGITLGCVTLIGIISFLSFIIFRSRGANRLQVLSDRSSNLDSSGYIDDTSARDNSEEMYSLDNDSFLNSLEAMTIQNYWTDTVKHTKL